MSLYRSPSWSAMSYVRSAVGDRNHSWCSLTLVNSASKFAYFPLFPQATPSYEHWHVWLTVSPPTNQLWLIFTCFVPLNCSFDHYSAFHKTFDKRFPKFVWNSRSSVRTWQFHYVFFYVVVNQIVNFETMLWISRRNCWEVAKFVASEVRVIRCSWLGNIIANEFKQSGKNFSTRQGLFYDVYFWNVNYMRGTMYWGIWFTVEM